MVNAPALVRARVAHRRSHPMRYEFSHRTTMWLVDAGAPNAAFPRWLRAFAAIRSEDHFAPRDHRPLLAKVRSYLTAQDLPWSAHRVVVLANARSLGHVFDPLTTYFCFDPTGRLEGVLAEVHNTYGERHCYPLCAAGTGRAGVDKEFYVSPFFAVEGRYDIRQRLTDDRVSVAIALTQDDRVVFTGSVTGDLVPLTPARIVRALASGPVTSRRVSALIRWHGVRLWLRRLPVLPRPTHHAPKGMA